MNGYIMLISHLLNLVCIKHHYQNELLHFDLFVQLWEKMFSWMYLWDPMFLTCSLPNQKHTHIIAFYSNSRDCRHSHQFYHLWLQHFIESHPRYKQVTMPPQNMWRSNGNSKYNFRCIYRDTCFDISLHLLRPYFHLLLLNHWKYLSTRIKELACNVILTTIDSFILCCTWNQKVSNT